jgi:hypothetical protein
MVLYTLTIRSAVQTIFMFFKVLRRIYLFWWVGGILIISLFSIILLSGHVKKSETWGYFTSLYTQLVSIGGTREKVWESATWNANFSHPPPSVHPCGTHQIWQHECKASYLYTSHYQSPGPGQAQAQSLGLAQSLAGPKPGVVVTDLLGSAR